MTTSNMTLLGNEPDDPVPGLLETHRQTQQKLEVMLRYWPIWCLIIAQVRDQSWCNRCMWLIDGFAGTGLHLTDGHPDGAVAGTPVQAFFAAVSTKHRFPNVEVHLRAVEPNPTYVQVLQRRLVGARGEPGDRPQWQVYPDTFHDAYPKIIADMRADRDHTHSAGPANSVHAHRSLWLIDPFGVKDIPHDDLEPLGQLTGAEVIINLDLGGLLRVKGVAQKALDEGDADTFARSMRAASMARRLDLTWGNDSWKDALDGSPPDILRALAQSYANTFYTFRFKNVYPLRGTRSQKRFLIHLTNAKTAADRFADICDKVFLIGSVASNGDLTQGQRATRAKMLHDRFAGTTTTVQELYELGMGGSRNQIRTICRSADGGGYGTYDDKHDAMTWRMEREPDPVLFPGF